MLKDFQSASLLLFEWFLRMLWPELESMWLLPSVWGLWSFGSMLIRSSDTSSLVRLAALWGMLSAVMSSANPIIVCASWTLGVYLTHLVTKSLRLPSFALVAITTFALSAFLKSLHWGLWGVTGGFIPLRSSLVDFVIRQIVVSSFHRSLYDGLSGMVAFIVCALCTWNFRQENLGRLSR